MNSILRFATFAAAITLGTFAARAAEPGYFDLGKFTPAEGCQFVEVNLDLPLLKVASLFVGQEEPQAAELIRNLKRVHVNVVGFNDTNRADTLARIGQIRDQLENAGWTRAVTVKQGASEGDADVAVFVKLNADSAIDGVVVTVIDSNEKQAVFVNVVGSIRPEQLAALSKRFNLPGLDKVAPAINKNA